MKLNTGMLYIYRGSRPRVEFIRRYWEALGRKKFCVKCKIRMAFKRNLGFLMAVKRWKSCAFQPIILK
jgi:hypothetical protein